MAVALGLLVAVAACWPVSRAGAATTASATTLLADLRVTADSTVTYNRDYFHLWIDADGNGCDTRHEVLIAESTIPATTGANCAVTGQWNSWYDGVTWTDPSHVDIDHLVPLQEAWKSGADVWTRAQREAYANDLTLDATLTAVTDTVNESKGSKDPAQWMPPLASAACTYATDWVEVKYRWNLAVDPAEHDFLATLLATTCADPTVTVPPLAGTPTPAAAFADVAATNPFAADINWLASTHITTGYGDGTFRPSTSVSREAMAAFLYRYTYGATAPVPTCSSPWFVDVATSSPLCGYVTWLARTGISTGYADATFHPGDPVSREAMAAFLQRYRNTAQATGTTCTSTLFTDMPTGTFCAPITWLGGTGITKGNADGSFHPSDPVSREAMAAFLHRYDNLFGPSNPDIIINTPPTTTTRPPTTTTTRPPTTTTTISHIPPNPGDHVNCSDFSTWAQAQAWFNTYYPYYGDVAHLDADHDGIACESLPGHP